MNSWRSLILELAPLPRRLNSSNQALITSAITYFPPDSHERGDILLFSVSNLQCPATTMARTPMNERSDIPGEASRGKAEHARRLREEPSLSPLLPTRRRALTNPEIPVTSTIPPSIRFLLLPLEIRLAIYTSAISLPSKSFTILQNEQNSLFYHRPLPVSFTREGRRWFTGSWVPTPTTLCPYYRWPVIAPAIYSFTIDDTYPSGVQFESFHPSGREEIRGLLGSCRQMYVRLHNERLDLVWNDTDDFVCADIENFPTIS